MSIFWNGSAINSLMWNGIQTTGVYNGNIVWGNNTQQAKTLTLYHSEGGSLTADTLTGYPGDSVNLSTAYDTYWRFSGYDITGDGTLNGNTYTFGNTDTTICACYKVNAFTATGGFEKGSNINVTGHGRNLSVSKAIESKYAIHGSHTGEIPSTWYNSSNRWHPTNASAYSITLNPKLTIKAYKYANGAIHNNDAGGTTLTLIGSTTTASQSFAIGAVKNSTTQNFVYNKTITTTTQNTYAISGRISAYCNKVSTNYYDSSAEYISTATTGTWEATGIAP